MAIATTQANIFQQAAVSQHDTMDLIRQFSLDLLGFELRVCGEIISNPNEFAESFIDFAKTTPRSYMADIIKMRKMAGMMTEWMLLPVPPQLDERLISTLKMITPETVEKAIAAFGKFIDYVNTQTIDLKSLCYLKSGAPYRIEQMQHMLLESLHNTSDPLADAHKCYAKPKPQEVVKSDPEVQFKLCPIVSEADLIAEMKATWETNLFEKLRALRTDILSKFDPLQAAIAANLLNTSILPSVLSQMVPCADNAPIEVESIRQWVEPLLTAVLIQTEPMRKSLVEKLGSDANCNPIIAKDKEDFLKRVLPATIHAIEQSPLPENGFGAAQRCDLVWMVLRANLAKIATVAKAATSA